MVAAAWAIVVIMAGVVAAANGAERRPRQDVFTASPAVLFRGYAMAACLAQAFPAISAEAGG